MILLCVCASNDLLVIDYGDTEVKVSKHKLGLEITHLVFVGHDLGDDQILLDMARLCWTWPDAAVACSACCDMA